LFKHRYLLQIDYLCEIGFSSLF